MKSHKISAICIVVFGVIFMFVLLGVSSATMSSKNWMVVTSAISPGSREYYGMAYDSESDVVVIFGGYVVAAPMNETWVYNYNTNTWTNMSPLKSPAPLAEFSMAYDSESDRTILFGGYDTYKFKNETWAYDYNTNTWTNMTGVKAPAGRSNIAMAYDSDIDLILLYGGWGGGALGDTWTYDFNSNLWTSVTPATNPPAIYGQGMAYDSKNKLTIMFSGGDTGGAYIDHTWAWNGTTADWSLVPCTTRPPARAFFGCAYDALEDRIVIYGGYNGIKNFNDTWEFNAHTGTWADMTMPSAVPAWAYQNLAYDSESDVIIMYKEKGQTWVYRTSIVYESPLAYFLTVAVVATTLCLYILRKEKYRCR